jgi:hypothetical protein
MPWSARFDDPIVLPDGRKLVTLKDARHEGEPDPRSSPRLWLPDDSAECDRETDP